MDHKEKNENNFKEYLKNNLYDGLLNIDFLHDNNSSKIKKNSFFDMINEKKIKIYTETKPTDLENFIHNELIDLVNGDSTTIFKNIFTNTKNDNKQINLSNYTVVLDKSVDNLEMKNKLTVIFGITKYENTFIGTCEKFLNNKNVIIDDKFLLPTKKLKKQYLIEAIKIGFLPISLNNIINYNSLNSNDDKIIFKEICVIKQYIDETIKLINTDEIDIFKDYKTALLTAQIFLNDINNIDDIKIKYKDKTTDTYKIVESIVMSLKETRDIYYIEEIKQKMDSKNKYILVTGDMIQSYRAIIENISTINVVLTIIRFLALYDNNEQLKIIGNPFELISTNANIRNNYMNDENKKEIIKKILSNPIITLRKNSEFHTKYLYNNNNYDKILNKEYLKYVANIFYDNEEEDIICINNHNYINGEFCYNENYNENNGEYTLLDNNVEEKTQIMNYFFLFAQNNITNKEDLLYLIQYFKYKFCTHCCSYPNTVYDRIIDDINNFVKKYDEQFNIKLSTFQFCIFYLLLAYHDFVWIHYIIPFAKKIYIDEFDWKQIDLL